MSTRVSRTLRRVERWAVGLAMAIVAFVLEKVVIRTARKEPASVDPTTTVTSRGGDVDIG